MSQDVLQLIIGFATGGGLTALVGKIGIPEYIRFKREKYEATINELKEKLKISEAKSIQHDKEKELVIEKYRLLEMKYKNQTNDVATTIYTVEALMPPNNPELKKIIGLIKDRLKVHTTPSHT